ncbi:type II secretion system ATPase GspE [bacterium]|nr:type II secretion system ATPase GspE [bacterium]
MNLRFTEGDENHLFRHSGERRDPGFSDEINPGIKCLEGILLEEGLVSEEELDRAKSRQKEKGESLIQALCALEPDTEEMILKALGARFHIPYQATIKQDIDPSLIEGIPFHFVKKNRIIPINRIDGTIRVAIYNPLELQPLDDIRLLTGCRVEPVLCPIDEIMDAINRIYHHAPESAEKMVQDLDKTDLGLITEIGEEPKDLLDLANEAPIIKLVNLILVQAIKDRASDIHIEPFEQELRVRYRIDGVLHDTLTPQKRYHTAIISRIKIMSKMNIAEKRLPQDGRIRIRVADKEIDIRVSTVPTAFGERVVMRLLDKHGSMLHLEELGMSGYTLKKMNDIIHHSHGIILVTGPTGSGKTTTLYAALTKINFADKNIITIEDPIEYQLDGIGQIQVLPKINLTFSNGLRSILRQDPDVIMVGEIRDLETAEIAIQASLTGHLVFSTLHTNDSPGAITRLIDMGVEPYLVSSSVIGILAQRLVRLICKNCKEAYIPDPEAIMEIGIKPEDIPNNTLYQGKGCDECKNTGYRGRTGIYELLMMDDRIRHFTMQRSESNIIKREGIRRGMTTLRQDGTAKVIAGLTTIQEVLRVTQEDVV